MGELEAVVANSSLAAAFTAVGGLVALTGLRASEKWIDSSLGFSAGVMIAVSFIDLLLPAVERVGLYFIPSFLAGVLAIYLVHNYVPHEHILERLSGGGESSRRLPSAWLIAVAVVAHNIPEGLAIGSSTLLDYEQGFRVALAISLQDLPEGYIAAMPFIILKKPLLAVLFSTASGLSEVVSALAAAALGYHSHYLLEHLNVFTAGAMIYVVNHEIVPESHSHGFEKYASIFLILGLVASIALSLAS